MVQRNIHGEWSISFTHRLCLAKISGETNEEGSKAYFNELQEHLFLSPESDTTHWSYLLDCRDWSGASLDTWEANNSIMDWLIEHNCCLHALVMKGDLQVYAVEKYMNQKGIIQYYFNYDEAYQACLDKLAAMRSQ